jgi:hypothetical protein
MLRDTAMEMQSITHQTAEDLALLKLTVSDKTNLEENAAVRGWLLPDGIDPETDFEAASRLRHSSTSRWFLDSDTFRNWLSSRNGFFWVYGIRMHFCRLC